MKTMEKTMNPEAITVANPHVYSALGVAVVIEPETRRVRYCYNLSHPVSRHCLNPQGESEMVYDMLCEVGQPWVERFERLLHSFKIEVEQFKDATNLYDRACQIPSAT